MKNQSDTIDMDIEAPAPSAANAAEIKKIFIEWALRSGALKADVIEKNGKWIFHGEFDDPTKAAACTQMLNNRLGQPASMGPKNAGSTN
jgi:hypothetical protein